jgi:peptidoglycan/LPS O-acetylase OafA/YrhL
MCPSEADPLRSTAGAVADQLRRPFRRGYIAEFDGLRAWAAILVVLGHATATIPAMKAIHFGAIGVRFFFALSGFLITGILLSSKGRVDVGWSGRKHELQTFYLRRALRIFPPYYAFLIFFLLAGNAYVRQTIAWQALYLTNFHDAFVGPARAPVAHFWTLAVEEQFYLLWPLLVMWLSRRQLKRVLLAGIVVTVIYRAVAEWLGGNLSTVIMLPFGCLDALGLGSLLALHDAEPQPREVIFTRWRSLAWWVGLPGFGATLIALAMLPRESMAVALANTLQLFCIPLISAGLLLTYGGEERSAGASFLCSAPLSYLGKISYGIYVYHFPFDRMVFSDFVRRGWLPDIVWVRFGFVVVCAVTMASLSWFVLERPVRSLKRYFPYSG